MNRPPSPSRDWIVRTILDLDATRGEVDAAMRPANPVQLEVARLMLTLAIGEEASLRRDVRGRRLTCASNGLASSMRPETSVLAR
jgi:hypothetical protein